MTVRTSLRRARILPPRSGPDVHDLADAIAPRRMLLACLVTVTLATSACDHHNAPTPPGASAAAQTAIPTSPVTASERRYRTTANPCGLLDDALLLNAFGVDAGTLRTPAGRHSPLMSILRCVRQYGPPPARSLVDLEVTIVTDTSAQPFYAGLRSVHATQYPLENLPGLGQGAYRYTDPDTGTHLISYDGNLYLDLLVHPAHGSRKQASSLADLLTGEARHAMTTLAGS